MSAKVVLATFVLALLVAYACWAVIGLVTQQPSTHP
jgi:hypothetical protein